MTAQIHPTAEIEPGVEIGTGTAIWSQVHVRGPARIGSDCIVGEKTYIAYGVEIGDRVKLNAFVYVCYGVVIEDGVMVGAGAVFTNDRYPRATSADLRRLRDSGPGESIEATYVREGATVGAGSVVGPGVEIGRFAMVGMGAVVTRDVAPFHLVVGNPAATVAYACRCGAPTRRLAGAPPSFVHGRAAESVLLHKQEGEGDGDVDCAVCGRRYAVSDGRVIERDAT